MSIKIINTAEVKGDPLPNDSWVKMLLTGDSVGTKKSCIGVSKFGVGLEGTLMIHEEEELAYVTKGTGKIRLKDKDVPFRAGDAIYIPAGVAHALVIDGEEDVEMVYTFSWPDYPPTKRL